MLPSLLKNDIFTPIKIGRQHIRNSRHSDGNIRSHAGISLINRDAARLPGLFDFNSFT